MYTLHPPCTNNRNRLCARDVLSGVNERGAATTGLPHVPGHRAATISDLPLEADLVTETDHNRKMLAPPSVRMSARR